MQSRVWQDKMSVFDKSPVSRTGLDYKEIKSHSSLLSNERIAILFYLLDLNSINLNSVYDEQNLLKTKSILYQIYKNIRTLIRNNAPVRASLNLETKDDGIYTFDLAFGIVEEMCQYCHFHGSTYKKVYAITQQLNHIEMGLRDVLQYFSYFFRTEFRQKPDVLTATEKYKDMADKLTLDQLRKVVGKKNKIDFEHLKIAQEIMEEDPERRIMFGYEKAENEEDED